MNQAASNMTNLVHQVASIVDIFLDVLHKNFYAACYTLAGLRGEGGVLDEVQLLNRVEQRA